MPRFPKDSSKFALAHIRPIPEVITMKSSPTNAAHAAHVAPSRERAQDGDTEAPRPKERDTVQPVAKELVELGASHRLPTVTYPRPKCPECGHFRLRKYRSITDQGDGTALSWVKCLNKRCGHRFRLLLQ